MLRCAASVIAMLIACLSGLPFDEARAQGSSLCVKNDEHCPAIEAQVNALLDLAEEVLKTKVIPSTEQIEERLGVKAMRFQDTNLYHLRPASESHLLFRGTYNTITLSNGAVRTSINFSLNKHACIGMNDLKSRLPGGRDETRSHGVKGERAQPFAAVRYVVEGDAKVYVTFDFFYQLCLQTGLFSVSQQKRN